VRITLACQCRWRPSGGRCLLTRRAARPAAPAPAGGRAGAGAPRAPRVELRRLDATAGLAPAGAAGGAPAAGDAAAARRARERLPRLLELLLQRSAPAAGADMGGQAGGPPDAAWEGEGAAGEEGEGGRCAPRWALRCRRAAELHALTCDLLTANTPFLVGVRAGRAAGPPRHRARSLLGGAPRACRGLQGTQAGMRGGLALLQTRRRSGANLPHEATLPWRGGSPVNWGYHVAPLSICQQSAAVWSP